LEGFGDAMMAGVGSTRNSSGQGPIHMKERRSIDRTRVAKGALLFFCGKTGVRSCCVRDITKSGAGIRTQDLPILPLNFQLSFDNFRTVRRCRIIWRDNDFLGVKFENLS
jgi:hypothetical protein